MSVWSLMSKNRRHSSFSCSFVNCVELSIVSRWVKNSGTFDFFMITNVSSTYLSHKRGRSAKSRFSTSSMNRFANTDETGQPIALPKTCLECFPRKVKFVEVKQISSQLIRSVVDKFVCWLISRSDCRRYLAVFTANWIGTIVNKDTTSDETIISSFGVIHEQ